MTRTEKLTLVGIAIVVFLALYQWITHIPTHDQPTDTEVTTRMMAKLEKAERGDILGFSDGRIAVVRDNFEAGQRIILRGPGFVAGVTYDSDSGAANLANKVNVVVKSNDRPTYDCWAVELVHQLAGMEGSPTATQPVTTKPTTTHPVADPCFCTRNKCSWSEPTTTQPTTKP